MTPGARTYNTGPPAALAAGRSTIVFKEQQQ
jgi:hypothetical protein